MKKAPYVYTVCRITKHWTTINQDLRTYGYSHMRCFVPTVQLHRKTVNNRNITETVPMLFNYAFVKMRSTDAFNRNLLNQIRKDIPGILCFMKAPDSMFPKKQKKRIDNAEDFDDFSIVATITRKEFYRFKTLTKQNKIYTRESIQDKVGQYVVLKNYPFDGLLAKVVGFNYESDIAFVEIPKFTGDPIPIQVPLDNIMYTIYNDYDETKEELPNAVDYELVKNKLLNVASEED